MVVVQELPQLPMNDGSLRKGVADAWLLDDCRVGGEAYGHESRGNEPRPLPHFAPSAGLASPLSWGLPSPALLGAGALGASLASSFAARALPFSTAPWSFAWSALLALSPLSTLA